MAAYLKAIIAALVAALGSLGTALTDGVITPAEWLTAAVALLVGLGATTVVANAGFVNLNKAPTARELAPAAFEAYSQAVGGVSVAGQKIPEWGDSEFLPRVRDAWTASTNAVLSALRR